MSAVTTAPLFLIIVAGWLLRKDRVFGRGHGRAPPSVAPENSIQYGRVRGIRMSEVHFGRFFCALAFGRINLVDQTIVAITPVSSKGQLGAWAGEQWRHYRSVGIVLIHGRQSKQAFHGVHHVDGGVEAAVDERMGG